MNEAIKEIQDDMVKQVDFLILLKNHWKQTFARTYRTRFRNDQRTRLLLWYRKLF
jgi:hypothetical protein